MKKTVTRSKVETHNNTYEGVLGTTSVQTDSVREFFKVLKDGWVEPEQRVENRLDYLEAIANQVLKEQGFDSRQDYMDKTFGGEKLSVAEFAASILSNCRMARGSIESRDFRWALVFAMTAEQEMSNLTVASIEENYVRGRVQVEMGKQLNNELAKRGQTVDWGKAMAEWDEMYDSIEKRRGHLNTCDKAIAALHECAITTVRNHRRKLNKKKF